MHGESFRIVEGKSPAPLSPVGASERIDLLDVLRGFALLIMLVVHFTDFSSKEHPILGDLSDFLLANKGLSIFSMLFGMGFTLQMLQRRASFGAFARLYLRRMVILFLIGVASWCLVFGSATVLIHYAVYGCILLLLSRMSTRAALLLAVLVLTLNVWRAPISRMLRVALHAEQTNIGKSATYWWPEPEDRLEAIQRTGSYSQLVSAQAKQVWNTQTSAFGWAMNLFPDYFFPMFLIGFAAVKSGVLRTISQHRKLLIRTIWCGLVVGLLTSPTSYFSFLPALFPGWLERTFFLLSVPASGLFYASALALAYESPRLRRLIAPLRWPGRMALTNYILHRAIVNTICYGYGFGRMNQINTLQAWGLGLLIFFAITLMSAWWLRRFRYGPLEWVWRASTYGRLEGSLRPRLPAESHTI